MGAVNGAGLTIEEPKLEDLFNVFGRKLKIALNCVKVGTIQSVDRAAMTASVQIVFQQAMRDGTFQAVPVLADCPLFTLQGGGYSLQFPIAKGDTALVLFSDRNLDNWFAAGGVQPPADGRLHDLSDAIALVGLNSLAAPLAPEPAEGGAFLVDKSTAAKLGVSGGLVTVEGATGQTLGAVLNTMLTAMAAATTVPQVAAAASTAQAALAGILAP